MLAALSGMRFACVNIHAVVRIAVVASHSPSSASLVPSAIPIPIVIRGHA